MYYLGVKLHQNVSSIVLLMFKQYIFEGVISFFGLTPSPLSQFVTILLDPPPP